MWVGSQTLGLSPAFAADSNVRFPHCTVLPASLMLEGPWRGQGPDWFRNELTLVHTYLFSWKYVSVCLFMSAGFSCSILGSLSRGSKKTLGQKLLGMLPSENSSKSTNDQDDPQEIFKMLIDLVSIFAFFVVRGCGWANLFASYSALYHTILGFYALFPVKVPFSRIFIFLNTPHVLSNSPFQVLPGQL